MKTATKFRFLGVVCASVSGIALLLGLGGCSNQLKDQGNIPQASPDYAVTIMNADNYPNITMVCFKGVGFMTITRDYGSSVEVPEWNSFCQSKMLPGDKMNPAPTASATP